MTSKRAEKKSKRVSKKDKWGLQMSLSRRVRRGLRRELWSRTFGVGTKGTTIDPGGQMVNPESGHTLNGGGNKKC